ncbi:unnamed protein product, partial [Staurois parvus]
MVSPPQVIAYKVALYTGFCLIIRYNKANPPVHKCDGPGSVHKPPCRT